MIEEDDRRRRQKKTKEKTKGNRIYKIMRTRMNKMFPLLELTALKSIYDVIIT